MADISREEGYRRSKGKEEQGIQVALNFCKQFFGITPIRIEDPKENYLYGDLRLNGTLEGTIEVKTQPIDPVKYTKNFVEVFEETKKERHQNGKKKFCELLDIRQTELDQCEYTVKSDKEKNAKGTLEDVDDRISVSIQSIRNSKYTIYVNPYGEVKYLYLYDSDALIRLIKESMLRGGLVKGAGNSNNVTFAVFVPLPKKRWSCRDGTWIFIGE